MENVELLRLVPAAAQPTVTDPDSIGELVVDALRRAADSFRDHDTDRTTESRDAEDLHQARVALRHIRSYLRSFRTVVDPSWASSARADLGWFGSLLGEVRNHDVLARRVVGHGALAEQVALDELLAAVGFVRNEAVFRLAEARVMPRYESVLATIDALSEGKVPLAEAAGAALEPALGRLLRRPWRNVKAAARTARRQGGETNLHQLRIRAKELRYACELATPVFGRPAKKVAKAARQIQDRLGEHRDSLAAASFMSRAAVDRPVCAYFAGQLAVLEREAAEAELDGLGKDFDRLRRRWRALARQFPR